MRRNIFGILLFFLLFTGCEKKKEAPWDLPPFHYLYSLAFVDEEDNDLVEGIEQTPLYETNQIVLRASTYTYEMVTPNSTDHFSKPKYMYLEDVNGYNTLQMADIVSPEQPITDHEILTRTLVSAYIFGDREAHTIVSYWKFDKGHFDPALLRVTVDDIEARIVEGLAEDNPLVIVTLPK